MKVLNCTDCTASCIIMNYAAEDIIIVVYNMLCKWCDNEAECHDGGISYNCLHKCVSNNLIDKRVLPITYQREYFGDE